MNNESLKLLKLFSKRNTISLKGLGVIYNTSYEKWCKPIAYLRDKGFLEIESNYSLLKGKDFTMDTPFQISYEGKCALEVEIKNRRSIKFNEIRAWVTFTIAIAAFIKSFYF